MKRKTKWSQFKDLLFLLSSDHHENLYAMKNIMISLEKFNLPRCGSDFTSPLNDNPYKNNSGHH